MVVGESNRMAGTHARSPEPARPCSAGGAEAWAAMGRAARSSPAFRSSVDRRWPRPPARGPAREAGRQGCGLVVRAAVGMQIGGADESGLSARGSLANADRFTPKMKLRFKYVLCNM